MKDKLFKILALGCLGIIAADALLDLKVALNGGLGECDGCRGCCDVEDPDDFDDFEDDLDEPGDGGARNG